MKIKNIFKKSEKPAVKLKVQKLKKTQLEQVVGGKDKDTAPVKATDGNPNV